MSRLEDIKDEVVREFGYKDFITYEKLMIDSYDFDNTIIIEKIAKSYAVECIKASLDKASEIAKTHKVNQWGRLYDIEVDKESITNESNIVLL